MFQEPFTNNSVALSPTFVNVTLAKLLGLVGVTTTGAVGCAVVTIIFTSPFVASANVTAAFVDALTSITVRVDVKSVVDDCEIFTVVRCAS